MCPALRLCLPALAAIGLQFRQVEHDARRLVASSSDPELASALVLARSASIAVDTLEQRLVRPIILPAHQGRVLPEWPDLDCALAYAVQAHIPFDLLVLDFDGAGVDYETKSGTCRLLAAIIERVGIGLRITPIALGPADRRPREYLAFPPTVWTSESYDANENEIVLTPRRDTPDETPLPAAVASFTTLAVGFSERVLMALKLIESVNVTLVTQQIPRMVRRHHRGKLYVPQLVTIRPTRKTRAPREPMGGRRLTMRHEVRGHFKHYPSETMIYEANPERVIWHPELGAVVQVWCPPYVAGPEGAPLRLKVWKLDGYVDTDY